MGGLCFGEEKDTQPHLQSQQKRPEIERVDEVKFKLKKARDTIKNFINAKTKDLNQIETKIAEKVPAYKQTGNKKQLIPLLKAKKDITKIIDSGQTRLKLVNTKLDEVEMQKINAETIDVLDDSNKYIREIQDELEKKDWRNVLEEAKQKYEIEFPDDREEVQSDPEFQKMWKELGGDKIGVRQVEKKQVNVQIVNQPHQHVEHRQQAYA